MVTIVFLYAIFFLLFNKIIGTATKMNVIPADSSNDNVMINGKPNNDDWNNEPAAAF